MRIILRGESFIHSFVWNKLFKKTIINNIVFPKDKIFEDIYWTSRIIGNAQNIVTINKILYHYLYRDDSLTHEQRRENRVLEKIEMIECRMNFICNEYPLLKDIAILNYKETCFDEYLKILVNNYKFDINGKIRKELHKRYCKLNIRYIFKENNIITKFSRLLFVLFPKIFSIIYLYQKRKQLFIKTNIVLYKNL